MPFEPFGYRFEVTSPRSIAAVKADIRARKKRWLEVKNGARGWIAGPFICLWFSAFDSAGPMLFGVISRDGAGTRIRGRAGSDLNGVLMFSLLIPAMTFVTYKVIAEGSAPLRQLLVIAALLLVGGPLVYWSAHKDRRRAEPLVRFLCDTVVASGRAVRRKSAAVTISKDLGLIVGGERLDRAVSPDLLHDALVRVSAGDFVILEASPEIYIQTAWRDGGYVMEQRNGDSRGHFRAVRRSGTIAATKRPDDIFDFDEVSDAFMAYASAAPDPSFLIWERMFLAD